MEYADVFALSNDSLGRTDVLRHEIHTGNTPLIRQHFRRVCPKKRQEMKTLLSEMLEKDIIRPSSSPWPPPQKMTTAVFHLMHHRLSASDLSEISLLPNEEQVTMMVKSLMVDNR